jgi:osmotically-inducible protein OsmY
VEDQSIELKGMDVVYSDPDLYNNAHVSVTSYNAIVLLSGQAPTEELRSRAEGLVRDLPKVRVVHNELTIAAPSSLATRTADSWITTKVKSRMLAEKGFDPSRVKVVTENGTVFLMGIVYRREAEEAVAITRQADGVQRVVKLFEYLD